MPLRDFSHLATTSRASSFNSGLTGTFTARTVLSAVDFSDTARLTPRDLPVQTATPQRQRPDLGITQTTPSKQSNMVVMQHRDKTILWEYLTEHTSDTVESIAELRTQLQQDLDEIDVKDLVRKERNKLDVCPLDDTDRQIIQLILDSERPWNNTTYLNSLTRVLQHGSGARITPNELKDWMSRMQYTDSRSGIITSQRTVQSAASRKNLVKIKDFPQKTAWTLFQVVEGRKITGQNPLNSSSPSILNVSFSDYAHSNQVPTEGGKSNKGASINKALSQVWKRMPADRANEHIHDSKYQSYWRLEATHGWTCFYAHTLGGEYNAFLVDTAIYSISSLLGSISTPELYREAYKRWSELRSDDPVPEKTTKYWQNLELEEYQSALTPKERKQKIKRCMKLLHETGSQIEKFGGECIVAVGGVQYDALVKVWGFGNCADRLLNDFDQEGVSLKVFLESRYHIGSISKNALQLFRSAAEHTTNTEPILPLPKKPLATEIIRREKSNAVKELLSNIPNLSTTPLFDQHGKFNKLFWRTHHIENWPSNLPTFLQKSLSEWTTTECNNFLKAYKIHGPTWSIVSTGKTFGALTSRDMPAESLEPQYADASAFNDENDVSSPNEDRLQTREMTPEQEEW